MASGQILSIQDFIQELIEAEPGFSSFAIYQRREGSPQAIIYEKEAIEIGLSKVLCEAPNQPKPFFTSIRTPVKMLFNRTVGSLTYEPSDAAEILAALLHFNLTDAMGEEFTVDRQPIEHTEDGDAHSIKTINLVTGGGVTVDRPQVATPALAGTSSVTATCATAGAQMFYSLNGSFPNPRNGLLYTAPVAVASGQTISVIGWLAGYTRSLIAQYKRP